MKIFITSNVKKYYNTYIDFIDHYWINFFEKKKMSYELLPSNKKRAAKSISKRKKLQSILILTGGSDVIGKKFDIKLRNKTENYLMKKCLKYNIPILGICRGAQLFAKYKKLKISKCIGHMRSSHEVFFLKKFLKYKKKEIVNSFHNYSIKYKYKKNIDFISFDKNQNVEMFTYKRKNIFVMWHPERNKNYSELNKLINYLKKFSVK